jgi:hypothetical protein
MGVVIEICVKHPGVQLELGGLIYKGAHTKAPL